MKKAILSVVLILALMLCACHKEPQVQTLSGVKVIVHLECTDVYGMEIEYCIDRKSLGVQGAAINPEMSIPINRGEALSFEFIEMDFSSADDLENGMFGIMPEILLKDGESISAEYLWEWNAQFGEEYHFILRGSEDGTFSFEPVENIYSRTSLNAASLN